MQRRRSAGFTIIELLAVAAIAVLVAAFAVPQIMNAIHSAKLRAAGSDFLDILQSGRIRAVQDNRFYSVYILTGSPQEAFADIYPQHANGTSGNGGGTVNANDPAVVFSGEITTVSAGSAPDTGNLRSLFLAANPSLPVGDGSTSSAPVTFGPRGLPCGQQTASDASGSSGTVCDNAGGATAFWVFFQNKLTQAWEAVTVSPSGRIQKWEHLAGGWQKVT